MGRRSGVLAFENQGRAVLREALELSERALPVVVHHGDLLRARGQGAPLEVFQHVDLHR